jgi:segregation and condensation protein B
MLRRPTIPAKQLRSVSARYRSALTSVAGEPGRESPWAKSISPALRAEGDLSANSHPFEREAELARLEAVLFLAREPLASRKLSQYANLADGTQARTLVRRLNEHYDAAGRAFRVEQVAGGYQLLTRRKLAPWLRRLAHVPSETRLSAPALETLAVIAYRQPVPRADMEAIRGVNCEEILRQLMERDLVRIDGRSEELGRPYLYSTTKRFLQVFGLVNLEELPRGEELRASPLPQAPPNLPASPAEPDPTTDHDYCNDIKPEVIDH